MGPSESTFTDPLTSAPRPWVETVSTPSGFHIRQDRQAAVLLDRQIAGEVHQ